MKLTTLAAAAVAFLSAAPAGAARIDLELEFSTVKVTFFGLDDAVTTPQPAKAYEFVGIGDTYNVALLSPLRFNEFVFDSSGLSSVSFDDVTSRFGPNRRDVSLATLSCVTFEVTFQSGNHCTFVEVFNVFDSTGQVINTGEFFGSGTSTATILPPSPIPLPAGGILLLTGLAGVAALKRRRKVDA